MSKHSANHNHNHVNIFSWWISYPKRYSVFHENASTAGHHSTTRCYLELSVLLFFLLFVVEFGFEDSKVRIICLTDGNLFEHFCMGTRLQRLIFFIDNKTQNPLVKVLLTYEYHVYMNIRPTSNAICFVDCLIQKIWCTCVDWIN